MAITTDSVSLTERSLSRTRGHAVERERAGSPQGHASLHGRQVLDAGSPPEHRYDSQWLGSPQCSPTARRAAHAGAGSPTADVQNSPGIQVWFAHATPTPLRTAQSPLSHIALAPAQGIVAEHACPS